MTMLFCTFGHSSCVPLLDEPCMAQAEKPVAVGTKGTFKVV